MGLVAPFTAAGFKIDLANSDRAARILKFASVDHAAGEVAPFAVRETLLFDASHAGLYQLRRQLAPIAGSACAGVEAQSTLLPAVCEASGAEPEELIKRLAGVPLARHFVTVAGATVSRSYEVVPFLNNNEQIASDPVTVLVSARAQCKSVLLKFTCEHDDPIRVELSPAEPGKLRMPQDILAVLGKSWRAAYDYGDHWRSTIRIDRREPTRTDEAELRIEDAVNHLVQTLTAPPLQFHQQHRPDRWHVMFRRAIPLGGCVALIGGALLVGQLPIGDGSIVQMLVFHAPPLLLIGLFLFRELPRFEVPPIPRKLRYPRWLEPTDLSDQTRPE